MFQTLDVTHMAQALARHAAARQDLVAANVANADTPGYRARDLAGFDRVWSRPGLDLRQTRPGHLAAAQPAAARPQTLDLPAAPNGNTVSLETEMVRAAEIRQQHDLALGVYSSVRDILRAARGRV